MFKKIQTIQIKFVIDIETSTLHLTLEGLKSPCNKQLVAFRMDLHFTFNEFEI